MKRPRILLVLSYYHPYISGVSEYAKHLAEQLTRSCEVTVLTGQHDPALPQTEIIQGVTVHRAPASLFLHKGYLSAALARRFRQLARSHDLINFHLPMLDTAWLTGLIPRGKPVISTYQCDVQPVGGLVDRAAIASVNLASRIVLRRSAKIVVLSRDYADGSPALRGLEDRLVEGFASIKDAGDPTSFDAVDTGHGPVIGFLGRFVPEKGIDVLIDAFRRLLASHPDATLRLAGDYKAIAGGSIYEQLRPAIEALGPRVELLGRLSDDEVKAFYRGLDVFVLPSVNAYEAFGMVQVEAMLAGTPVIASDMRGVRVPIQKTGNGWLCPPGNAERLAETLATAIAERHVRPRAEVRQAALDAFSNEVFVRKYEALIATLTS